MVHKGQKEILNKKLEVVNDIAESGRMAQEMTELFSVNVISPSFRDWVMPSFSIHTDCDKVVAAI